jgi:hypothetical protein
MVSGFIPATPAELAAAKEFLRLNTERIGIEKSSSREGDIDLAETQRTGKIVYKKTQAQKFAENPEAFFNESRRNQILGEKQIEKLKQQGTGTKEDPIKLQ